MYSSTLFMLFRTSFNFVITIYMNKKMKNEKKKIDKSIIFAVITSTKVFIRKLINMESFSLLFYYGFMIAF